MSFDNVCKYLAEQYPQPFVEWLLGIKNSPVKVLKTELNLDPIRADSVLLLRLDKRILHLEFQTEAKSKPPMPLRMLDYSVRLKRKYGLDVAQIIIFLKKTESEVVFQDEYRDETTTHKYRIIRLWEEDTELFLQQPILYPFAVLGKSESPEVLLEKVATKIDDIDNELKPELMACTYILAGLKLEKRLIKSLLKEEIMKNSVTYQEIVQEAEVKGEIRGKIQGEIQGKRQEALTLLEKMIRNKLELFDADLFRQIENLTLEKMEDLAIALLTMDYLGDLELWLEENT